MNDPPRRYAPAAPTPGTEDLGERFDASAHLSTRDRRQQLGRQVFFALHSIVRNARVHGEDNAAFAAPLEQLSSAIGELISTDGSFDLKLADDGIYVNRQGVRLEAASAPLAGFVKGELATRGIHGLSAAAVPPAGELRALVRLFTAAGGNAAQARGAMPTLKLLEERAGQTETHNRSHHTRLIDAYSHAVFFVSRYIELLRTGGQTIPVWAASRVVQDLVDLQRDTPLRFLQLARTKAGGEAYWGYHAANVAVLSISFGARLGFTKRRRHDLGMSSLFHDVGMAALPSSLLNKEDALDERERAAVAASSLFAARAILRDREVHPAALERAQGAHECHAERPGGAIGRVLAICEAFDALTTTRPWRKAHTGAAALQIMQTELAKRLDARLLELFEAVVEPLL